MPSTPTIATVKHLFAVSGNRCAFPRCPTPMVDPTTGAVLGEVCHIEAASPGGPRYNAAMSDDERHGFGNLVLLCANHHKVVDDDDVSYTRDRLRQMKAEQVQRGTGASPPIPSDAAAERLVQVTNHFYGSGNVISMNQMGGQTAHSITNIGRIDRVIAPATAQSMVAALRGLPPTRVCIQAAMNDAEAYRLAEILRGILEGAGWDAGPVNFAATSPPLQGLSFALPDSILANGSLRAELIPAGLSALARLLGQLNLAPQPFPVVPLTIPAADASVPQLLIGSQ